MPDRALIRRKVVFKNYKPRDASLKEMHISATSGKAPEAPSATLRTHIAAIEAEDRARPHDRPLALAPKKDTWDLKRDLGRKLKALDETTEEAIHELVRARAAARRAASREGAAAASASSGTLPAGRKPAGPE